MCEYEGEEKVLDSNGQKILDGKVERVTPHLGEISADSPFFYELNYTYSTDYMNQDISLRYYDIKGDMLCDINILEIEDIISGGGQFRIILYYKMISSLGGQYGNW